LRRTQLSKRELGRVEVLARVRSRQPRVVDASRLLRVSDRQAKRLWKRYREEGAAGLQHQSAGRSSNRAHEEKFRQQALQRVGGKYSGAVRERFGPTPTDEHLASEDGLVVSVNQSRRGTARMACGRGIGAGSVQLRYSRGRDFRRENMQATLHEAFKSSAFLFRMQMHYPTELRAQTLALPKI